MANFPGKFDGPQMDSRLTDVVTKMFGPTVSLNTALLVVDVANSNQFKATNVLIDSSDNITGINNLTAGGTLAVTGVTTLSNNLNITRASANVDILLTRTTDVSGTLQFRVDANGDGTISNTTSSKKIIFGTSLADRFKLYDDGIVEVVTGPLGINTASPTEQLHIIKAQNGNTFIQIDNLTAGTMAAAGFKMNADTATGTFFITGSTFTNVAIATDSFSIVASAVALGDKDTSALNLVSATAGKPVIIFTGGVAAANQALLADGSQNVIIGPGSTPGASLDVDKNTDALALRVDRAGTTVTNSIADFVSNVGGANTTVCSILVDGDIENINGAFGSISDPKVKQNVKSATSKLDDVLKLLAVNYELIAHPGKKLLGFLSTDFKKIFPGLVKSKPIMKTVPDKKWNPAKEIPPKFEEFVVEPERIEKRQSVKKITKNVPIEKPVWEDGRFVKKTVMETQITEELIYDEFPVYDEDGNELEEKHLVPKMEDVIIPAETKQQFVKAGVKGQTEADRPMIEVPTGEFIESIIYSVLTPILVKAMQEQQDIINNQQAMIDELIARITVLEAA